jgi:hypothetical protein
VNFQIGDRELPRDRWTFPKEERIFDGFPARRLAARYPVRTV